MLKCAHQSLLPYELQFNLEENKLSVLKHQSLLPYEPQANLEENKLSVLKHYFSSRTDSSNLTSILPKLFG